MNHCVRYGIAALRHNGSLATLEDWFDPSRFDEDYVLRVEKVRLAEKEMAMFNVWFDEHLLVLKAKGS